MSDLVEVRGLRKHFPVRTGFFARQSGTVRAVENVSFTIRRGEILGLVGESGSGKTSVGRLLLRLIEATEGSILFDGADIGGLDAGKLRALRRRMQIVFQDPFASLNPRMTVEAIIGEAFDIHALAKGPARKVAIADLLSKVGLAADSMARYPHEFSGGQRQRICIARALAVGPSFLVADEPVSALDVSVQAQVVGLLQDLRDDLDLTVLFISHDLAVVEHIADRVVVMYFGHVMEIAPSDALYRRPRHPYTRALLAAIPVPDPDADHNVVPLKGELPSVLAPPSGCVFRTRCPLAATECAQAEPPLRAVGADHFSACIRADDL